MADTANIIERLGGVELLAKRFGLSRKAFEMWERRGGIPGRWHIDILLLAKERGVKLSLEELSTQSQTASRIGASHVRPPAMRPSATASMRR